MVEPEGARSIVRTSVERLSRLSKVRLGLLKALERDVMAISVRLAYTGELYYLRLRIRLLTTLLRELH